MRFTGRRFVITFAVVGGDKILRGCASAHAAGFCSFAIPSAFMMMRS